jgi:uncharacterized protein involved in exopolysaccharide biosynthesis
MKIRSITENKEIGKRSERHTYMEEEEEASRIVVIVWRRWWRSIVIACSGGT